LGDKTIAFLFVAVKALREIHDTQGRVCPVYEICEQKSCKGSYESWIIADKALKELELLVKEK